MVDILIERREGIRLTCDHNTKEDAPPEEEQSKNGYPPIGSILRIPTLTTRTDTLLTLFNGTSRHVGHIQGRREWSHDSCELDNLDSTRARAGLGILSGTSHHSLSPFGDTFSDM